MDSAAASLDNLGGDVGVVVIVFEAGLFRFLDAVLGFVDAFDGTFLYAAGSGTEEVVLVAMRVERRRDIVRCRR